jgi:hypothetical protein
MLRLRDVDNQSGTKAYRSIRLFKHSYADLHPTSKIVYRKGPFDFGNKWSKADRFPSLLKLEEGATLEIDGYFRFFTGAKIYVNKNATLKLGNGYMNHNANISCFSKIAIGNRVVMSENVTILKEVTTGKGAVVKAGAVVTKDVAPNSLVGGIPAKVLSENAAWE